MPVVDGLVSRSEHGETELPARLACGHTAGGPVDRPDLVAPDVPTELGAQFGSGGPVEPFGFEHLGEKRPVLRTSAMRSQIFWAGANICTVTEPSMSRVYACPAGRFGPGCAG